MACDRATPGGLALILPGRVSTVVVDDSDAPGVRRAAQDLVADLKAVGGGDVRLANAPSTGATVIAGTLGQSPLIDALVRSGRIDVSGLKGQWEGMSSRSSTTPRRAYPARW